MMDLPKSILNKAELIFSQLQVWRRHLHQNPELSFEEEHTSKFIQSVLHDLGVQFKSGFVKHGIVAQISGKQSGDQKLILRADMDALPIEEKTALSFKSTQEGVMHACGHDIHTACLLGAVSILNEMRHTFSGSIDFVFQPGEELLPGGAKLMLEEKAIDLHAMAILGQHVEPTLPAGTVGFHSGKFMASCDELHISVTGNGGHAATPHKINDTVLASAQLIVNLQQVCSRLKPTDEASVLSIGYVNAAGATNVIPNQVSLQGTFRALNEEWRSTAHKHILRIAEATAKSHGVEIDMDIRKGYPSVFNHPALTDSCKDYARELLGEAHVVEVPQRMGGEDFGYYSQAMKGCFWRLGVGHENQENYGLHSNKFNPNEKSMLTGSALMAYLAIQLLNENKD